MERRIDGETERWRDRETDIKKCVKRLAEGRQP